MDKKNVHKKIVFLTLGKRLKTILVVETALLICGYLFLSSAYAKLNRNHFDTLIQQLSNTLQADIKYAVNTLDISTKYPLSPTVIQYRDDPLWQYLLEPERRQKNIVDFNQEFKNISAQTLFQFPALDSLILLDTDGHILAYSHSGVSIWNLLPENSYSWLDKVCQANGKLVLLSQSEANEIVGNSNNLLYGVRVLSSISNLEPVCVTLNSMHLNDLSASFHVQKLYDNQYFALFNSDGNIIYQNGSIPKDFIHRNTLFLRNDIRNLNIKDMDYTLHTHYDSSSGTYLVIQTPTKELYRNSFTFYLLFGLLIPFIIISNLIFFGNVTMRIAKPLDRLVSASKKIGKGNFSERIPSTSQDELGYVTDSFNLMSEQVETLINEVYIRKMAEQDLELQMLRSQINPHFLYNTLESMRMSAYTKGYLEHAEMCRLLAKILRYGVATENHLVTVGEELVHLQDYVNLLEYRFHDQIKVQIQIAPDMSDLTIIKLLLQPLVENCINHGIINMDTVGCIQVWGYLEKDCIIFNVSDNGSGMDADTLYLLNGYLNNENQSFTSIGLKNIHRRIKLYYGDDYGLSIESRQGMGTSVTIRLPLQTAPHHHTK